VAAGWPRAQGRLECATLEAFIGGVARRVHQALGGMQSHALWCLQRSSPEQRPAVSWSQGRAVTGPWPWPRFAVWGGHFMNA
jgi:hypothetical protein